ncbi:MULTISPECIES: histidine kinase dimerization/phosphoacceptor domain -containing protein [unclassified Leptolyngbya]|uniref:histidine kinase dimerization/phosphoacceptor domain -containing protein n=1 Tax=unclassified Leptolyngbya TaxID=2650499 RepID=UPI0018F04DB4|nr:MULTISPECIES: histidine kinase dimerization/phosphoacceptor domain -containing protein [unclassified Leptolyngbya]
MMMSKAQSSCVLPGLELSLNTILMSEARASGILIVNGTQPLGVFAERDALQAIVSGQDLTTVKISDVVSRSIIALTQSRGQNTLTALAQMRQHRIHHLPVLDEQGQWLGIVTLPSIRKVLQLDELLKSKQLGAIVSPPAIYAPATTTILDLAQQMVDHAVDCIVLTAAHETENNSYPVGLILERHILQLWSLGLDLSQIQAQTIMSTPFLHFASSESVLVAYWKMQQARVQRFGVYGEQGDLLGVVSPTSFLQTLDLNEMYSAEEELQQSIEHFKISRTESEDQYPELDRQLLKNPSGLLEQLKCSQILATMALHIRESLTLHDILQRSVEEVRQFLKTDRVIIYQFNPDWSGTTVVESIENGWRPALNSSIRDTCFGQNYAQAYKEGRTQVCEDIYTAGLTQCHIDILALYDVRASLVVPILQGEHLWGLLCAYQCSGPRRWRAFEVELLKQLATHMAIAIQQSELYQQAQNELKERKRTEEQLKLSLKEKEVLLKEIHHRVKNNLQVISSVLRLQSDYIKDDRVLALFKDSQNRIRSMALIHEKLHQSSNLLKINFAEYIRDLADNLLRSYAANSRAATLRTEAENVWLNIDTAIPCGLIINELVSNALKHAFPASNPENEIVVRIFPTANKQFTLGVQDNGIGFPPELDFRNTESLGLELVCIFTEQLEGTIKLDQTNGRGTTFTITFSELENTGKVQ